MKSVQGMGYKLGGGGSLEQSPTLKSAGSSRNKLCIRIRGPGSLGYVLGAEVVGASDRVVHPLAQRVF